MKKLLIVAFLALTALPIHAAEEAQALSPFAGNLGNAIWTLGIFVIVVIVLGKFAWGPVLGLLFLRHADERFAEIEKTLKDITASRATYDPKLAFEQLQAARL